MNVKILMGRGVEGTGNTRFSIELYDRIKALGNDVEIIANNEKKWGRRESQKSTVTEFDFRKVEVVAEEGVDHVIITSVPAKNYSQEGINNFINLMKQYRELGTKITYIQVDHKIHSISRNMYRDESVMHEFFDNVDLIITHDLRNDFNQKFVKRFNLTNKVIERLCIGADMSEFEHLRKDASEKIDKSIYFIGRSAGWKGWMVLRDLQHAHLKNAGYKTVIEGIELSIGVLGELYKTTKPERIERDDVVLKFNENDQEEMLKGTPNEAYIYGPYVRPEAVDRISKSKFGFFGTFMGEQFGGPLENTMLEIVNAGTLMIIRKELYDCASVNGVYLKDFTPEEMGVIVYDPENVDDFIYTLNMYNDNDQLYNEIVSRSLEFFTKYFDTKVLLNAIWEGVLHEN